MRSLLATVISLYCYTGQDRHGDFHPSRPAAVIPKVAAVNIHQSPVTTH